MVTEKQAAFGEAWLAMATQAAVSNQALAMSYFWSFWSPSGRARPTPAAMASQLQSAAMGVLDKGLAPIHRKTVANAKRLARTKLR